MSQKEKPTVLSFSAGRRRVLNGLGGLALAAGLGEALTLSGRAQAQDVPKKNLPNLRVGYIGSSSKLVSASGWALQQGYLQRELTPLGINGVTTYAFPNGPDLNEAFLAGTLDLGVYGDTPALVARSRDFEGRLIGFEEVGMNVWLLTPKGGVTNVKQLAGKVVATSLGSYMHRYLIGLLKQAGIADSVKVTYLLPRDAEPALASGSIAAYAAPIDTGPLLAAKGYPVIDEAASHPELAGTSVIVGSKKTLAALPGLPGAWLRARHLAVQDIRKDSDAYYRFTTSVSGYPIAAIKASRPLSHLRDEPYPADAIALLNQAKQFLLTENLIGRDFDLSQWRVA